MDAALFSWSGLVITVVVALAIGAIVFLLVGGVMRVVSRHRSGDN